MGQTYLDALWKAVQQEYETDTLICQIQSVKEIIDEVGNGFLNQDTINALYKQIVEQYYKSNQRINENNEMAKKEHTEEDEDEID